MGSIAKDSNPGSGADTAFADVDVAIIGAGISGINAAYRVQTELPDYNYTIIEARSAIGGTWDFFRYPGIRSDSDLHTFGFPWRPWTAQKSIADGASIRNYIRECAEAYGIDRKIQFHHRLVTADWSSENQQWTLSLDTDNGEKVLRAQFVILSTGYYDYKEPLKTTIPGIDNFKGQVVHPQFWPENFDFTGKKMVLVGSGATAVTLLPCLAEKASKVTMLQRSPSYILPLPSVDPSGELIRKFLPKWLALKVIRWKSLILPYLFYKFCCRFPSAARRILRSAVEKQLPKSIPHDPNFRPSYSPWEQRLCVCPDADFYRSLRNGTADIVTDKIKEVTATGIETESGKKLDADIIVTATGLKMQLAGGAVMTVDSKPIVPSEKFIWKGMMLQDVPNAAFVIGYTNASWTLGSDTTALHVCRLLKYMDKNDMASATPRVKEGTIMPSKPLLNLSSTYIERAKDMLPRTSNVGPWKPRNNYLKDTWIASYGSLTTDMQFTKAVKKVN